MTAIPDATENRVPNDQIREAFLRSGLSASEVAIRCGWYIGGNQTEGDSTKVRRALGIAPSISVTKYDRYRRTQMTVSEADAVLILRAIDVAPRDVDL